MSSARTLCRDMPVRYAKFADLSIGNRILEIFGGKSTGFFIDIGASHPWVYNNTWILEKEGWDGILVEPNVHFVELLEKHREATVVHAALWSEDGEAAFNTGEMGSALVATGKKCGSCYNHIMSVETLTIGTFLDRYKDVIPKYVDFISVDAQYAEHTFYRGLPLAKVISMEIHSEEYQDEILGYFRKKGYLVEHLGNADYLFIRQDIFQRIKQCLYSILTKSKRLFWNFSKKNSE